MPRERKHKEVTGARRSSAVAAAGHGYPRPMLVRDHWISLDGTWDFAIDETDRSGSMADVKFKRRIIVPFAPESRASGIGETGHFQACWYRRNFEAPPLAENERLILHFAAVDYLTTVWINGSVVAHHEGGYTPFSADITEQLREGTQQTIVVCAQDDPLDLAKPRGKQDWKPQPHAIWYYRTSGIWQSVWLERVNATHLSRLQWTPNVRRWQIALAARITQPREGLRLRSPAFLARAATR